MIAADCQYHCMYWSLLLYSLVTRGCDKKMPLIQLKCVRNECVAPASRQVPVMSLSAKENWASMWCSALNVHVSAQMILIFQVWLCSMVTEFVTCVSGVRNFSHGVDEALRWFGRKLASLRTINSYLINRNALLGAYFRLALEWAMSGKDDWWGSLWSY